MAPVATVSATLARSANIPETNCWRGDTSTSVVAAFASSTVRPTKMAAEAEAFTASARDL